MVNSSHEFSVWWVDHVTSWLVPNWHAQNFIACISVNHSLKIDTSAQSFSEPFTESRTKPTNPTYPSDLTKLPSHCLRCWVVIFSLLAATPASRTPHFIHNQQIRIQPEIVVTGQLADMPTRGLPTRGLDISRTGQLAARLDNSHTSQLADWTSHGLDNSQSRRCRQKNENWTSKT